MKRVHRRTSDDLPAHVKGRTIQFINTHGEEANGYYILDVTKNEYFPVEFLQVEGEDRWYYLTRSAHASGLYTSKDHLIPLFDKGTGFWNVTDPQHPAYVDTETRTSPVEDVLAAGLHHIVTTQGSQPLSPQEPILPQIEAAVAQGIQISLETTPAAAILPPVTSTTNEMEGQAEIATAIGQNPTQQINVVNPTGSLKGNPPPIFEGDRKKSRSFLVAHELYRGLNRTNTSMTNPYSRVLNFLTYIEGEHVNAWKENQLRKLLQRSSAGTPETSEAHWDKLIADFREAFTDTNAKADAYQKLTTLKQGDSLDTFIATFKKLADEAELDHDTKGTIELFKAGLKPGLTRAIIGSQRYDPLNPWNTLSEWEKEAQNQHIKWKAMQQYTNRVGQVKQGLFHALKVKNKANGGRRTTSQGGDAMDVDAARTSNLTDEQKAEMMKKRQCFYCQKVGHQAKECYKKKRDQQSKASPSSQVNATENDAKDKPFDPKKFGEALKEHGPDLDEDTKLDIVEMLLPQGFLQALD